MIVCYFQASLQAMESNRPKKHSGGMYGGRSSYIKSKELAVDSDEDNVHDSLSDEGLSALQFLLLPYPN